MPVSRAAGGLAPRAMMAADGQARARPRALGGAPRRTAARSAACAICRSRCPAASCRGASPSSRPSSTPASCACRSTSTCPTSGSRPTARPSIAVPFYLAHPRLEKLEAGADARGRGRRATSGACASCGTRPATRSTTPTSCACGASGAQLFGRSSEPYPEFYTPKPYSKSFVLHLDPWYAQSHPDEDFAETFAVWLTPDSEWRQRYAGWPALKKLEYMDALMRVAARQAPRASTTPTRSTRCRTLRKTLRQHYRSKRRHYGVDTRTSTTATCAACSPTRRSSPTT